VQRHRNFEPPRRTKSEALAHRREFKAAMRQRIRDIAASRDLSAEEIKPALTLKHHEIAKFIERHGVNAEWLLEGTGRIFLNSSTKSAALAARYPRLSNERSRP
jgi:hypothetical protein